MKAKIEYTPQGYAFFRIDHEELNTTYQFNLVKEDMPSTYSGYWNRITLTLDNGDLAQLIYKRNRCLTKVEYQIIK